MPEIRNSTVVSPLISQLENTCKCPTTIRMIEVTRRNTGTSMARSDHFEGLG
ncbi:hypothetical protein D3C75_1320780 [compost metagenome]